jgi:hypothetical protein
VLHEPDAGEKTFGMLSIHARPNGIWIMDTQPNECR